MLAQIIIEKDLEMAKTKIGLREVLKNVHRHVVANDHSSAKTLEVEIKQIVADFGYSDDAKIDVGFSEEFNKKLFYFHDDKTRATYIYCDILDKPFDLVKVANKQPRTLFVCQRSMLEYVENENEISKILEFVGSRIKDKVRFMTSMISCFRPSSEVSKQIFKEIIEDNFEDALLD